MKKILIVDDLRSCRLIVAKYVEKLGFAPLLAQSGNEALKIITKDLVDAVITDKSMPDMSGFDLIERLILINDKLPIAMISGYTEEELKEEQRAMNLIYPIFYIPKPVDRQILTNFLIQSFPDIKLNP